MDSGASSASTVWRQVATSGEPEKSARRKSLVISVVGSTTSNPSPCWLPLDTGVRRLHLFALVAEDQGTTEHTEHTETNPPIGMPSFRGFGVFRGSLIFGDKSE